MRCRCRADINNYESVRNKLSEDDFVIFCDSFLKYMKEWQVIPGFIIWENFYFQNNPHMEVETIVLPFEKGDTDTVFAVKEVLKRD